MTILEVILEFAKLYPNHTAVILAIFASLIIIYGFSRMGHH